MCAIEYIRDWSWLANSANQKQTDDGKHSNSVYFIWRPSWHRASMPTLSARLLLIDSMKLLSPVLRPAKKANKKATTSPIGTCDVADGVHPGEQAVKDKRLADLRADIQAVFTGCSPHNRPVIDRYLQDPAPADKALLDAWARCGRADAEKDLPVKLQTVARDTFSPLGLACLICYSRAYLDAVESKALEHIRD